MLWQYKCYALEITQFKNNTMYLKESLICKKQNVGKTVGIAYTDAFTLGLLDYGNHDYFGQY
jgi:hypothetical protein